MLPSAGMMREYLPACIICAPCRHVTLLPCPQPAVRGRQDRKLQQVPRRLLCCRWGPPLPQGVLQRREAQLLSCWQALCRAIAERKTSLLHQLRNSCAPKATPTLSQLLARPPFLALFPPAHVQCGIDCLACKDAQTCTACSSLSVISGKCTRCADPRCQDCAGNAAVCRSCEDERYIPDPTTKRCRLRTTSQERVALPMPRPGMRSR